MPRKTTIDETRLVGFGKWLMPHLHRRGWTVNRLADQVGMDAGHLGKIIKSYETQYSSYTRPGYENTVAIGKLFNDVPGALEAAEYEVSLNMSADVVNESRYGYSASGPIETITREAGYDPTEFDAEEMDELQRGIRAYTDSWLMQKRKQQGRN